MSHYVTWNKCEGRICGWKVSDNIGQTAYVHISSCYTGVAPFCILGSVSSKSKYCDEEYLEWAECIFISCIFIYYENTSLP